MSRAVLRGQVRRVASVRADAYNFAELGSVNHLGLPRLPIPPLEHTIKMYLESARALAPTDREFQDHAKIVEEFAAGVGKQLHDSVVAADAARAPGEYPRFYFEHHWDEMYFGMRCPCPINSNPFYLFKQSPDGDVCQMSRTARMVVSAVKWWRSLLNGTVPVPLSPKGAPQCMGQYPHLIATARIPRAERDTLLSTPDARHIVVLSRGHFYKLEMVDENGSVVDSAQLAAAFRDIDSETSKLGPSAGIASLTSNSRDAWSVDRERLMQEGSNKQLLEVVDTALVVVALDSETLASETDRCKSLLHGTKTSLRDRWWDKMTFVGDRAGNVGLIMEHAPADGASWNSWLSAAWEDMHGGTPIPVPTHQTPLTPQKLEFSVSPALSVAIANAEAKAQEARDSVNTEVLIFNTFGKNAIKGCSIAPDAFVQVALQATFSKVRGGLLAPTYESCSTRAFWRGRTETIRSCTPELRAFVTAFLSGAGKDTTRPLLRAAAEKHVAVTRLAAEGKGIDRHLLALRKQSESDSSTHERARKLFQSELFQRSGTWELSTSNVTSSWLKLFGFGPVAADGFGVGYQTFDEYLPFVVSSNIPDGSQKFVSSLHGVLEDFLHIAS